MNQEQNVIGREILETNPDESNPPISDEFIKILGGFDEHHAKPDKKLNHNASERNRRKKISDMYASLRSILPTTDSDPKMKKLSFPSTITRALKFIPELQQEVEILNQKKEELKLKVDKCRENENIENGQGTKKQKGQGRRVSSSGVVTVNTLGDEEVLLQLCTNNQYKQKIRLSYILKTLEEEGLLPLHMFCFESFGKVFHNLHIQCGNIKVTEDLLAEIDRHVFSDDEGDQPILEEGVDIPDDASPPHTSSTFKLPRDVALATKVAMTVVTTPPKRKRPSLIVQDSEFVKLPSSSVNLATQARENLVSLDTLDVDVLSVAEKLAKSKEDVKARKLAAKEAKKNTNKRNSKAKAKAKEKEKGEDSSKKARAGTPPPVIDLDSVQEEGVLDNVIQEQVIKDQVIPEQGIQDVQDQNVEDQKTTHTSKDSSSQDHPTFSHPSGSSSFFSIVGGRITHMPIQGVGNIMERGTVDGIFGGTPLARALTAAALTFPTDSERLPTSFTDVSCQCFAHLGQSAVLAARCIDYSVQQTKEAEKLKAEVFEMKHKFAAEVEAEVAKARASLQVELDEVRQETEAARRLRDTIEDSEKQLREYVTEIGGKLKEGKARLEQAESEIAQLQREIEEANAKIVEQSKMVEQSNNNAYASGYAVGVSYMRARKDSKAWTTSRFKIEMPFPDAAGGVLEPRSPRRDSDTNDDEEYEDVEGDEDEDEAED